MTDNVEKAKPGPKPKATTGGKSPLVIAVHRINGEIEPGTPLRIANIKDYNELLDLDAVRPCSEAETALYEKNPESVRVLGGDADLDSALA